MKRILHILLWLLLITSTVYSQYEDIKSVGSPDFEVDFGSIIASEETLEENLLYLPFQGNSLIGLEVWVQSEPDDGQGELPGERLSLKVKQTQTTLSLIPQTIQLDDPEYTAEKRINYLPLTFILKLMPFDLPGEYQWIVCLREVRKCCCCPVNTYQIKITVKIEPWIRITKNFDIFEVTDVNILSKTIQNQVPYILKIASNTPWNLRGKADLATDNIKLYILNSNPQEYQTLNPNGISLSKQMSLLAVGPPATTEDHYWINIPTVIKIHGFTELPAGSFGFDLLVSSFDQSEYIPR